MESPVPGPLSTCRGQVGIGHSVTSWSPFLGEVSFVCICLSVQPRCNPGGVTVLHFFLSSRPPGPGTTEPPFWGARWRDSPRPGAELTSAACSFLRLLGPHAVGSQVWRPDGRGPGVAGPPLKAPGGSLVTSSLPWRSVAPTCCHMVLLRRRVSTPVPLRVGQDTSDPVRPTLDQHDRMERDDACKDPLSYKVLFWGSRWT